MATTTARPRPFLRLRGKSFMSVVLTPDLPLADWVAQLDEQVARSPKVFEGRPVLLDVSLVNEAMAAVPDLVAALGERGIRVIGIDGSVPYQLGDLARTLPPVMAGGRNAALLGENEPGYQPPGQPAGAAAPEPARAPEPTALVLDQPVRSGQSVTHTAGDVTVVGSVASGSEILAGGSIHVYGTLRGRAIAGLLGAHGRPARASSAVSSMPSCWPSTACIARPTRSTRSSMAAPFRRGSTATNSASRRWTKIYLTSS